MIRSGIFNTEGVPDAKKRWFELFLAKQLLIAEALTLGYDKRPEVEEVVETMERHMLSRSNHSSTDSVRSGEPVSEERLRQIYSQVQLVPTVIGVRLSNAEVKGRKGEDWPRLSSEARLQRLKKMGLSAFDFYSGPLPWPYEPFPEAENELRAPAPATWVECTTPETTTILYIESVDNKNAPPFEQRLPQFDVFARDQLQQAALRRRRSVLLAGASLRLDSAVAARLVAVLATCSSEMPEVPRESIESVRSATLAEYKRENIVVTVTVEDWRRNYNRQFVRRLPRTLSALQDSLRELAATELEVAEARKQGLDQAPQFSEDRRNFSHFQALDLFEKEKLMPNIETSDEALRNYYSAHLNEYSLPVAADCVGLRFESREKAMDWVKRNRYFAEQSLSSPDILDKASLVVSRESPVPEFYAATDAIVHSGVGAVFGPVLSSNGWMVILKRSTQTKSVPYNAVTSRVRAGLIRQRLDEAELKLSRELGKRFEVQDTIPYSTFGVPDTLDKPWK